MAPNLSEKDAKRLSFIIAATDAMWDSAKNKLTSLPQAYIDEMKRVQPFNGFGTFKDRSDNLLILLRDLDNQDKHHLQIVPSFNQLSGGFNLSLKFEGDAAANRAGSPRMTIRDIRFEDNTNLFDIEVNEPIADIVGTYNVEAELIVESNGIRYNAVSILLQIVSIVQVVADCFQAIEDPNCRTFRVLKRA